MSIGPRKNLSLIAVQVPFSAQAEGPPPRATLTGGFFCDLRRRLAFVIADV
jgi:hypothetical protein